MQIFWLKRNLRLQDSAPFFYSMKAFRSHGKVLPLYIHEPSLIAQPDVSRQHQRDDDVRAWCKTHGADLSKRFAPLPFASNPANEIPLAKGTDSISRYLKHTRSWKPNACLPSSMAFVRQSLTKLYSLPGHPDDTSHTRQLGLI